MNSSIRKINSISPEPPVVQQAADLLLRGELVVAPTETRYGLLADGGNASAIARLYRVKGREWNNPTALFVPSVEEIGRYGRLTVAAQRLAERFLPGPLTLVLKALVDWNAPRVVNGKIGIRVTPSPIIGRLLEMVGSPLTATSANLSGKVEGTTVTEIANELGDAVGLYIDGGPLDGLASTVVDCSGDGAIILRAGAIAAAEIG